MPQSDVNDLPKFRPSPRCRPGVALRAAVLLLAATALLSGSPAVAQSDPRAKADGVPRYVSLRSDEVNVRSGPGVRYPVRSEEHTSELQSLMRISYAVFCLKKKKNTNRTKSNKKK